MFELGFEILLEDDAILAVNKPAGVATQAPPKFDSLEVRLKAYLASRHSESEHAYLGIPHRLDRPVSGAIIFAKTRRAARQISRQFERRQIRKSYWACVESVVEPPAGTWTDYLWKVHGQPRTQVVESTHAHGQQAILHYQTIGSHRYGSWLEVELETGRTHQVRVQAASRGYPIVGDAHYGSTIPFGPHVDDERLRPIALHARALTFVHPTTRVEIMLEAPLSEVWGDLALVPKG